MEDRVLVLDHDAIHSERRGGFVTREGLVSCIDMPPLTGQNGNLRLSVSGPRTDYDLENLKALVAYNNANLDAFAEDAGPIN
ncbi:MAG: hypothetical protein M1827_003098 [Pycnora praestabilis]|nr:MAG: hypothetical protein M1827_003098 [Pycnora praestabilis]